MNGNSKPQDKSQDKYYKVFLIAFFVILALPLLAAPPMFHPAPWGKALVFRIIISSLLFLFIWQIISGKIKFNLKFPKPFWLLIALWVVFLLATIFSLDPYYSFWGSPYRAGGFLNFSLYIIFAILAFLIIRKKHWQKIWDFALIIGILVSIMTIFQYFGLFKEYLIPSVGRPPASFGNSIFLAIYLLFLVFLALSFGLKEKKYLKKFFYFSIVLLFIFILLIVKSRAVYLGLLTGFLYFFLFYFSKSHHKKILCLKIIIGAILILTAIGIYSVNTTDQLPEFVENNRTLKEIASRLSFELLFRESRFSGWQIAFEAVKEKPILGWGPENFSIAFDKYYDPHLPELSRTWWDRAHNFIFDISIEAGVPALIIYLSLFAALFWQLQKVKTKTPNDALIYHGIQAVFIGYLTANFFSFDCFSTYLILFLIIAYSLFLIRKNNNKLTEIEPPQTDRAQTFDNSLWKSGVVLGLLCILILFIWSASLKPLNVNKEINWANYYSENNQCEKALERIDNVLPLRSNIDAYVRLQYIDIIRNCLREDIERKYVLAPKAVEILRELKELRPYHTRTWISLGNYLNVLIENKEVLKIENVEELEKEAHASYQRAYELSPKREEVFLGWIETDFLSGNYQEAKEKAEQCINLNPKLAHCWWKKALAHIYLNELEQADENIAISVKMGYNINSSKCLFKLQRAYIKLAETIEDEEDKIEIYERLADVYERLIDWVDPKNFQYRASLSHIYMTLERYREAREQALYVVRFSKEHQENVKEFLNLLFSLDNDYFLHYFALTTFYYEIYEYEKAFELALIAEKFAPPKDIAKNILLLGENIYQYIK